ncbi:hypothetical protein K490DRAFT_60925 [Saccharata proteae CBS 121410]|uniref:TLDc domain-containing protein n=1 Tax=Saccharata proteae CBS 121410 TaxID=1314787 RepID=A0A9P4I2F4_9PEZI|nr:hypothetical protein K490DRAFT_60925 [Saccharata proteae CBS 121410]
MATSAILSLRPLIVPISMGAVWQVRHAAPASALFTPSTTTQTVDGLARGGLSVGTVFIVYQMSQSPVPAGSWAANRQSILMVGMIAAAAAFASVWTEETFIRYLSDNFPATILRLDTVGPVLYRLVVRLGSYPYHQQADQNVLTLKCFKVAVALLTGQYWRKFWDLLDADDVVEEESKAAEIRTRLLFQSLRGRATQADGQAPASHHESEIKDDVRSVLELLEKNNKWRDPDNPKVVKRGLPLPPVSALPPCHSDDLRGEVAYEDLGSLIRLLLVMGQYTVGCRAEDLTDNEQGLDEVVSSIMAGIIELKEGKAGRRIPYAEFRKTLITLLPNLYDGFGPIFATLVKETGDQSTKPSQEPIMDDSFLTLPLIHQLASFLPLPISPANLSRLYAGNAMQLEDLVNLVFSKGNEKLLLLVQSVPKPSDVSQKPSTIGALLAADDTNEQGRKPGYYRRIFELSPKHRAFAAPGSRASIRTEGHDDGDIVDWSYTLEADNEVRPTLRIITGSQHAARLERRALVTRDGPDSSEEPIFEGGSVAATNLSDDLRIELWKVGDKAPIDQAFVV